MPGSSVKIHEDAEDSVLKFLSREALKILFSKAGALACIGFSGATLVAITETGLEAAGLPPGALAIVMEVLVGVSSATLSGKILIRGFRGDREELANMARKEGQPNHGVFGRHKPDF